MRKRLVAAVALAPLCLAAGRGAALAQVTITSGNNITTSSSSATTGEQINLTGSVGSSSSSPAVTINSSNSIANSGSISISGVNNSTSLLADTTAGPLTASITNTGTISNSESFTPSTANGLNEEPFASSSSTGRYGLRVIGSGLTGDITNAGTITAQGNQSYAVSIEAPLSIPSADLPAGTVLTGVSNIGLINTGTISYTGDNGVAIQSLKGATIHGNVLIEGAVTSLGQSKAIDLEGDVDGRLSIYSSITSTAYATPTRPSTTTTLQDIQGTNGQVDQSGGAVVVNGNVGSGIFIGSPPVGTSTTTTADLDGDGIVDAAEGVGTVVNYGSAPGFSIGNSGATAVTISAVGGTDTTTGVPDETVAGQPNSTGTAANGYGLIVRGSIAGEGVYDGVGATGLQIGSSNGAVNIAGGVRVTGSISADSFLANATAISIGQNANVPEIRNEDFIESSVSNSSATGTLAAGLSPTQSAASTAISIGAGAQVGVLTNYGTIQATANGDSMTTTAVVDRSGTLKTVLNEGVISAVVTPQTSGASAAAGSQVALDLSSSTSAISLTQMANPSPIAVEVSSTTNQSGMVTTTAALTTATSSTTTTVTTTTAGVTTTTTTTTPTTPQIIGDVLLGTGSNNVQLLGGSVTGALSLGGGTNDVLNIYNGATFDGALTNVNSKTGAAGSGLALTVNNGTLLNTATSTLNLSGLTVGSKGLLYAAIDPSAGQNTLYNVSGIATLAQGAQLGIILKSPLFDETTYKIVSATTLNDNSGGALASAAIPFVLVGTETETTSNGVSSISIDLRRRTAAEMDLNPGESAALNAVYTSLPLDPQIEQAVLGQYTRSAFLHVYDQLLPDYSGGVFELTLAASDAVTRATSRVNDIENPSGTRGAWAEEVAFGVNHDRGSTPGYQGGGFGFVGGLETGGAGLGAFGVTGSFLTGDIKDPHAPGDNLASFSEGEFGGYWQGQLGGIRADARAAGGYVLYADRRELLLTDATGTTTLDRQAKGSSSGYTATGHFGLGYQTGQLGWFYFRPQVHGDYFYLDQGGFTEHGGANPSGGDGFDLTQAKRNGNEASGTAALVTGLTFGQGFKWHPELELGYRDVFSGTAGATTASFTGAATPTAFTLEPNQIKGGGPIAHLDVKADTDFYELNFEAGVEQRTEFTEADLRLSVRVLF